MDKNENAIQLANELRERVEQLEVENERLRGNTTEVVNEKAIIHQAKEG
ncbi:hypothetical protein [Mechercharimyces sp. CAU 1602]|nr:hypothetical protein [Mechercharimyces sp. CAU 1602]MCS1352607.1 hypothetical protein [Mechercharimyces sp. CAU 1602]